ncbi:hypothetical protein PspLS_10413 [Pyricularia sp. CBS 133598]|nr:hypothetical protein PspLS_10413 [Pyricularia sp. CBS 133598]
MFCSPEAPDKASGDVMATVFTTSSNDLNGTLRALSLSKGMLRCVLLFVTYIVSASSLPFSNDPRSRPASPVSRSTCPYFKVSSPLLPPWNTTVTPGSVPSIRRVSKLFHAKLMRRTLGREFARMRTRDFASGLRAVASIELPKRLSREAKAVRRFKPLTFKVRRLFDRITTPWSTDSRFGRDNSTRWSAPKSTLNSSTRLRVALWNLSSVSGVGAVHGISELQPRPAMKICLALSIPSKEMSRVPLSGPEVNQSVSTTLHSLSRLSCSIEVTL